MYERHHTCNLVGEARYVPPSFEGSKAEWALSVVSWPGHAQP
jgi:hypothetical protein